MTKSFTAQVDDFIAKSKKNTLILIQQSVQDVVNDAQTPVKQGGRMRIKTGFLRWSGQGSLNGMPTGPSRGELKEDNSYQYEASLTSLKINEMTIGSTFHFGWTANYAKYRELHDGFLETSLQNWSQIVAKNTEEIRKRSKL